jgi:hypothetical protein
MPRQAARPNRRAARVGVQSGYGVMFWLSRKRFVGS